MAMTLEEPSSGFEQISTSSCLPRRPLQLLVRVVRLRPLIHTRLQPGVGLHMNGNRFNGLSTHTLVSRDSRLTPG